MLTVKVVKDRGTMDFRTWIVRYKKRDSPIGDLAYDISRDPRFPSEASKE